MSRTQDESVVSNRSTTVRPSIPRAELPLERFVWGAGIECSFLPHLNVDQFQWTQHERFWREDFRLATEELGVSHLRYAFPWHVLEPEPGRFDWTYSDARVDWCAEHGIDLMLDIMHFGTPLWLRQAVGDPLFPESLERFSEAIVSRYSDRIRIWCPMNEPLVCALFSGDFGFWPPHARKWRGYMPVLSRLVQGLSRGVRAIRRAMPEATVLLCDAAENYKTRVESLRGEVERRNLRRFVVMDLLTGRVDSRHPLYNWLTSFGMSDLDIEWFRENPQTPDILGLDYYPHSDWQVDLHGNSVRQRRAENPLGLYGVASVYYQRYGIPLMLTETSVDGQPINREIWLDNTIEHIRQLRADGIPMLGMVWWPMLDQVDWDGALTHRIGKIHQVGLYTLARQPDGVLARKPTPLVKLYHDATAEGEKRVGAIDRVCVPSDIEIDQTPLPTLEQWEASEGTVSPQGRIRKYGDGNGNGHPSGSSSILETRSADPVAGISGELTAESTELTIEETKETDRYGIVVFSHLRWGFVWQRPQQFLSRFARKHQILFIEEPMFDRREGAEPDVESHRVMPNVTVMCPHCPQSWSTNPKLPDMLRAWTKQAIDNMNEDGTFDRPLLWYYSPMDSAWSLGYFENRGIVYDCMDELSAFTGAPKALISNEARLIQSADIVFTGGYELWTKKSRQHDNAHFFGCGVEYDHFAKAQDRTTTIPPDIDFMARPILGWFGVVDERVDYAMVGEMARMKPEWSFAMVGPVVKVDPNLLPHSPNLFWMGGRDYQVLPNYCAAFDICMMPFAMNASTQYINPTKALEYFATGRPVIGTPVKDVVRQYSGLVDIVKTAEEFVAAADRLLRNPDPDRIRRGIELAQANSWDGTVKTMQNLIRDAIRKTDRPSSRKIESLTQIELSYVYQPTPGS